MRRCFLHSHIDQLVREAIQTELRRLAAEEFAQWARCFGPAAPKDRAARIARIIRVASARSVAAHMNMECARNTGSMRNSDSRRLP
jgi:truncated hemoglobin YjbI